MNLLKSYSNGLLALFFCVVCDISASSVIGGQELSKAQLLEKQFQELPSQERVTKIHSALQAVRLEHEVSQLVSQAQSANTEIDAEAGAETVVEGAIEKQQKDTVSKIPSLIELTGRYLLSVDDDTVMNTIWCGRTVPVDTYQQILSVGLAGFDDQMVARAYDYMIGAQRVPDLSHWADTFDRGLQLSLLEDDQQLWVNELTGRLSHFNLPCKFNNERGREFLILLRLYDHRKTISNSLFYSTLNRLVENNALSIDMVRIADAAFSNFFLERSLCDHDVNAFRWCINNRLFIMLGNKSVDLWGFLMDHADAKKLHRFSNILLDQNIGCTTSSAFLKIAKAGEYNLFEQLLGRMAYQLPDLLDKVVENNDAPGAWLLTKHGYRSSVGSSKKIWQATEMHRALEHKQKNYPMIATLLQTIPQKFLNQRDYFGNTLLSLAHARKDFEAMGVVCSRGAHHQSFHDQFKAQWKPFVRGVVELDKATKALCLTSNNAIASSQQLNEQVAHLSA